MRASLHPDLRVSGHTLVDSTLGLRYTLTPDAAWVVTQLLQEDRIDLLITSVARLKRLSEAQATQSVYTLFSQLSKYGAIRLRQEGKGGWLSWRARWFWPSRQRPTIVGLLVASGWAYGYIFAPLQGGFIAAHYIFGAAFPLTLTLLPACLVASLLLHEIGHICAARYAQVPVVLLSNPGYLAMLYKRPNRSKARCIAVAGPLLAGGMCFLMIIFCETSLLQVFLTVTGCAHFASLLPFFADGKTIWRHS